MAWSGLLKRHPVRDRMGQTRNSFFDIVAMDALASGDSPLHRLDPRAKLATSLVFIVAVVSFDPRELFGLLPFCIYPAFLIRWGRLPVGYLLGRVAAVAPLAILVGIFNPFFDRDILFWIGPVGITGGWASFLSILLRFFLTALAALILLASTGFNAVCDALIECGVPRPFVMQLLFFHRYAFVLTEEALRMARARSLRARDAAIPDVRTFASMAGHLLLRAWDRAERIYLAMRSRGFDGHLPLTRTVKNGAPEAFFILFWSLLFIWLRFKA